MEAQSSWRSIAEGFNEAGALTPRKGGVVGAVEPGGALLQ